MNKSTLGKIILTVAVAVGGVGFFVRSSFSSAQHYMMVHELMGTDLASWTGKELKVHGFVESGSIHESVVNQETHRTFLLQREGYAAAITNPQVLEAIKSGPRQKIAICFIDWSGAGEQRLVLHRPLAPRSLTSKLKIRSHKQM